jgi:Lrp/AsnC family transcriptional regulator, leucine-responsive regulatory protein
MNDRIIDGIDLKILNIIRTNAKLPNVEIARQVGMAPSAVLERVRKLEEQGIIKGYITELNPRALNLGLLAFVSVSTSDRTSKMTTAKQIAKIPGVLEVHHIAGEDSYLVKVRAADTESLGRMLREDFGAIKSVSATRTTVVLETILETSALPTHNVEREKNG